MKRLVVGALAFLVFVPAADAAPHLTEDQAVRWVARNCAEIDGVDRYNVEQVRRATSTVVHWRVAGVFTEGEFDGWETSTTITVKKRHGRLTGWNALFGWY